MNKNLHFFLTLLIITDGVVSRAILILPGINGRTASGLPPPADPAALDAQITLAEEQLAELTEAAANSPARLRIKELIMMAGGKFSGAAARLNPIVAELMATTPKPTPAPTVVVTTAGVTQPVQTQTAGLEALLLKKKANTKGTLLIPKISTPLASQLQSYLGATTPGFAQPFNNLLPAPLPTQPPWQNGWNQFTQSQWNPAPPAPNYWNQGPPPAPLPLSPPLLTAPLPTLPPLTPPPPMGPPMSMNNQPPPTNWGPNTPPPWNQVPPPMPTSGPQNNWAQSPPDQWNQPNGPPINAPYDSWNGPPPDYWNQPSSNRGPPSGAPQWGQNAQVFGQDGTRNNGPPQQTGQPWPTQSNFQGPNNFGPVGPNNGPGYPQGNPNDMGPGPGPGYPPRITGPTNYISNGPTPPPPRNVPGPGNGPPPNGQNNVPMGQRIPPMDPNLLGPPLDISPITGPPGPARKKNRPPININPRKKTRDPSQLPVIQINIGHPPVTANTPSPTASNKSGKGPKGNKKTLIDKPPIDKNKAAPIASEPTSSPANVPPKKKSKGATPTRSAQRTDTPPPASGAKSLESPMPSGPRTTPPGSWKNKGGPPQNWERRNNRGPDFGPNGPVNGPQYPGQTTPPYSWGNNNNGRGPTDQPYHQTTQPYGWDPYVQGPGNTAPAGQTFRQPTTPPYNWNRNNYGGPPGGQQYAGPTTQPRGWGNNATPPPPNAGPTPPPTGPAYPQTTQPPSWGNQNNFANAPPGNAGYPPTTQVPYPGGFTTQGPSWGRQGNRPQGYRKSRGRPADQHYPSYTTQANSWDPHYSGQGTGRNQWRPRIRRQISEPFVIKENSHTVATNSSESNHVESPVHSLEQLNALEKHTQGPKTSNGTETKNASGDRQLPLSPKTSSYTLEQPKALEEVGPVHIVAKQSTGIGVKNETVV